MADIISVSEIAKLHSRHRSVVHKMIVKQGIATQLVRSEEARGQKAVHISVADYELHKAYFANTEAEDFEVVEANDWAGFLYIMQLEPTLDPGRFKIGFAADVDERLRKRRTAAPFETLVYKWRCKLLWEKTAIESITRACEKLHTEVFRTGEIARVIESGNRFFSVMPDLSGVPLLDEWVPLPLIRPSATFSP